MNMKGKFIRQLSNKKTSIMYLLFIISVMANVKSEPPFSLSTGKQLNYWWAQYFETKDEKNIIYIMEYVNTDDLLLQKLNEKYEIIRNDMRMREVLQYLEVELKNGYITSSYDTEIFAGYYFREEKIGEELKYLLSIFKERDELIIRCAIKSAAFWSLLSNSNQYEDIRKVVKQNIYKQKTKTIATYKAFQSE